MRHFIIKQRESKEAIACLTFNNFKEEKQLIIAFIADMIEEPINVADTIVSLLRFTEDKFSQAGRKNYSVELEGDKIFIYKIILSSYIEEIEGL